MRHSIKLGLLSGGLVASQPISAQMTPSTVTAGARALSFLRPAMSGPAIAAIVYQPGNAASEAEASAIERALGSGLVAGGVTLKPKRVAANNLSAMAGARVAFVTRATNYREVAAAAASRSIITIGSDPACATAGFCVIAISAVPRIQIFVSKAACHATKVSFGSAFLMLVKEV